MVESAPNYRLRLFLSVDLSGSTAFKAQQASPIDWVPQFSDFFSQFTSIFHSRYAAYCEERLQHCGEIADALPMVWKTIGDEIVYVVRVDSCLQLAAYLHSFCLALRSYGQRLAEDPKTNVLDVKGNGWVASFPFPNQTIASKDLSDLGTEDVEKEADEQPDKYEFLGPGIDAGFRISTNASNGFMTVSPALAQLICTINMNQAIAGGKIGEFPLGFKGMNRLKGVLKNEEYPIIGISTERNDDRRKLDMKKSEIMQSECWNTKQISEYLRSFVEFHEVPIPALKLQPNEPEVDPPAYYTDTFLPRWQAEFKATLEEDESFSESVKHNDGDSVDPNEVISDLGLNEEK